VNFNTVARAYRILDEAGIISTQQGRGTYILEAPAPEATESIRREALQALTQRYISDAVRAGASPGDLVKTLQDQLAHRQLSDEEDLVSRREQ
jgi:GntR family transcriptional regulator